MVGTWTCREQPPPNRGLSASVTTVRQEEEEELPSLGTEEAGQLEVRVDAVDERAEGPEEQHTHSADTEQQRMMLQSRSHHARSASSHPAAGPAAVPARDLRSCRSCHACHRNTLLWPNILFVVVVVLNAMGTGSVLVCESDHLWLCLCLCLYLCLCLSVSVSVCQCW